MNAQYTVKLKSLLEDPGSAAAINQALSNYPLYEGKNNDEFNYIPTREQLNTKLLNAYKWREIGFETPGRFIDELEIAMNEIMPYYNQLFKSADIMNGIEDPFGNVDVTETFTEEITGESKSTSSGSNSASSTRNESASSEGSAEETNHNKNVHSDQPGSELQQTAENIEGIDYATTVTWDKQAKGVSNSASSEGTASESASGTSEAEATGESSQKTTHTMTKKGNQGVNTYAHDMKELRETFLNIEKMIINDDRISILFMRIF